MCNNRWLPISIGAARFLLIANTVLAFKWGFNLLTLFRCLRIALIILRIWLRDLRRERVYQGNHSSVVQRGLKWGLLWFLFSEIWFFFRIFWRFFHLRISPLTRGVIMWPLVGLDPVPAFQVPLLNTVLLLMRGVTATLAHQEVLKGERSIWIFVRRGLGFYFLSLQGIEYYYSSFNIRSGRFGRIFFMGTGFHGLHVCLGMAILLITAIRSISRLITSQHHFRLEFTLWYWHFVDVVWLFLFFFVYAWGR